MGINVTLVECLVREGAFRPITGDILTVGRQTIYFTPEQILAFMRSHGLDTSAIDPGSLERDTSTLDPWAGHETANLISDTALFRLVTQGTLHALDRSDYEGADIIHDLSQPLPPNLHNVADFVVDGSTLDNTFNPVQTLKNYCELLRPGGRLLMINAFSGDSTPYCIMPPMWYLDYFVMNKFVDAKIYVFVYRREEPQSYNVFVLDLDYVQEHKRRMGRFVCPDAMNVIVFAEKGPSSTSDVFPVQQDYRSNEDWDVYCRNLAVMQRSERPQLLRSNCDLFIAGVANGHKYIDRNFKALDVPDRLVPKESTVLSELPVMPAPARWDMVTGLSARIAWEALRVGNQPVLRLVANATSDRHAIAAHFPNLAAGTTYRAVVRFKTVYEANVMIAARDGTDAAQSASRNECEVRIDGVSGEVLQSAGNHIGAGVEVDADGWKTAWVDLPTADGQLYLYFGLLELGSNFHVFTGRGQEVLFGGFEISIRGESKLAALRSPRHLFARIRG